MLRGWAVVRNYLPFLVLCWVLFQFGRALAGRTLLIFSATIMVLLATAILFGGKLAMWCVVGVGLFTSIGWSNIFSLALDGMGVYKSQVSSLLVMAISAARSCRRCRAISPTLPGSRIPVSYPGPAVKAHVGV